MPHADEALKTLIARFEAAPTSPAFIELAAALLSRGHAAEALRVAEHGLQRVPDSIEGRVERAAALLALGRPRVAYVELRRALALEPQHRRALRLLGRAYRDAGAPGRAAELLTQRFFGPDDEAPSTVSVPRAAGSHAEPPTPPEPTAALDPNLFSNLTVDLGLGAAIPEAPLRRVEITQIIRRKGMPRPPRSASELVAIDGPIVDTTQPGQIVEAEGPLDPPPLEPPALAPLFDLADEPLFADAAPFEVRPVLTHDLGPIPRDDGSDIEATLVESIEETASSERPPIDLIADLSDPEHSPLVDPPPRREASRSSTPSSSPFVPARPLVGLAGWGETIPDRAPPSPGRAVPGPARAGWPEPPGGDEATLETPVRIRRESDAIPSADPEAAAPTSPGTPALPAAARSDASTQGVVPRSSTSAPTLGGATVERARFVEGRIVLVRPKRRGSHLALALLGAAAMILYATALLLASADRLSVWLSRPVVSAVPAVPAVPVGPVDPSPNR